MPSAICGQVVSLFWKSTYSAVSTPWILSAQTSRKSTRGKNSCHSRSLSGSEQLAGEGRVRLLLCKCVRTGWWNNTRHIILIIADRETWDRHRAGTEESHFAVLWGPGLFPDAQTRTALLMINTILRWGIQEAAPQSAQLNVPESLWIQLIHWGSNKKFYFNEIVHFSLLKVWVLFLNVDYTAIVRTVIFFNTCLK